MQVVLTLIDAALILEPKVTAKKIMHIMLMKSKNTSCSMYSLQVNWTRLRLHRQTDIHTYIQ